NPFVLNGACGCAFNLRLADLRKLSLLAARKHPPTVSCAVKRTKKPEWATAAVLPFSSTNGKSATIVVAPIA
ncbi:MAG TPA: hypothetical protein VIH54_12785, partial [Chthoniobacterales bacterium]